MGDDTSDAAWDNLIAWLEGFDPNFRSTLFVRSKWIPGAGRGLFTTTDVPKPDSPLFNIPKSAHMNSETLCQLYDLTKNSQVLSATQLISLHLFLHRPNEDGISLDPKYGPYISILPSEFDGHPLTWKVKSSTGQQDRTFEILLDSLPPAAERALAAMSSRFWEDWKAVKEFLKGYPQFYLTSGHTTKAACDTSEGITNYLWAWLNVNTRCIYLRLYPSSSDPNNLTLCPVVDLANHTSSAKRATTKSPIPSFLSPSMAPLKEGDEVFLKYGAHSNITLFTEYGFIEKDSQDGGQVDIQDYMESLFDNISELGDWMKEELHLNHYWGDWTLHDTPPPSHPSYRVLTALRLHELSESLEDVYEAIDPLSVSPELRAWQNTIWGEQDIVSESNETAVWSRLGKICSYLIKRSDERLQKLHESSEGILNTGWTDYALDCIKQLWLEERRVAEGVKKSIETGENLG